jgi:hypothetical protein
LLLKTLGFPEIRPFEMIGELVCYMYINRRLKYNEVVPICAMEEDRLSGGMAPLFLKIGSIQM